MLSFSQFLSESQWDRHYIAAGVSSADRDELARLDALVNDPKISPSRLIAARNRQAFLLGKYRLFDHVPEPAPKPESQRKLKWASPTILGSGGVEQQIRSKDGRFVIRKHLRHYAPEYGGGAFGYELIDLKNSDNYWGNLNFLEDAKDEADEIMEKEAAAKKAVPAAAKAPKAQRAPAAARRRR